MLDIRLAKQCDKLIVAHEFANPFGEDEQADIQNIITMLDGGIISQETAIEMNPLVKDAAREKERMVTGMAGADTEADEQPESRTGEEMVN